MREVTWIVEHLILTTDAEAVLSHTQSSGLLPHEWHLWLAKGLMELHQEHNHLGILDIWLFR